MKKSYNIHYGNQAKKTLRIFCFYHISNEKRGKRMRRKGFIIVPFLILLAIPNEVKGLQSNQNLSPPSPKTQTSLAVLYNKVLVFSREGRMLSGLLVGVENDSLVIRVGTKDEAIPLQNLGKVVIETKKKTSAYAFSGMLLGIYLGSLIFLQQEDEPAAYLDPEHSGASILRINPFFASGGGLLGFLAGIGLEKGEQEFNFMGSESERQSEWERLKRFISGEPGLKRMHISVQASHVFTQVSPQYLDLLNDYYQSYYYKKRNFNLLRKLQVTFSNKKDNLELGLAVYWLGEPSVHMYRLDYMIDQITDIKGYYALAIYKHSIGKSQSRITWNFGLGLGQAKINFSLKASTWYGYPSPEIVEHIISKTDFSGVAFTELNLNPKGNLSIGLLADYAFIPAERAPAIPEADIPAQNLRFGTGSIGFTLGFHF